MLLFVIAQVVSAAKSDMGPDQLSMIDNTSAAPDDPMWLQPLDAGAEEGFNALLDCIATPKAASCNAGQQTADWQTFCLPSPGVSPQHTQQVQQFPDAMAQVVPDSHGSLVGPSASAQPPQAAGAVAAGVSTAGHMPLAYDLPMGLQQWDCVYPDPSAAVVPRQQVSMGAFDLSDAAICAAPMPALASYHTEPFHGTNACSAAQAVLSPTGLAAAGAGPGMPPTMQYPAQVQYAGPTTAVPAGMLSSMSSLESCQSSFGNFPAAHMGASQLPYTPQAALLPAAYPGQWQVVPAAYTQQLNSPLLCCAGMGPAPYSMPAGWSMLPSNCLQADGCGMHGGYCDLGAGCAGCAGMNFSGSSSSNSASAHNSGTAAMHADVPAGSAGSYGVTDAAAAAASVLAAARASSAAARSAGCAPAGAGFFVGAGHHAAAVGTWPTAHASMAAADNGSHESSNGVQQQLAMSAQAAGHVSRGPATGASLWNSASVTVAPFSGAAVPSPAPGGSAGTQQGSRTRSSPMCSKASAQVKPRAARLCAPANKVIAKVLRSRLAGGIQDKLHALANPLNERKVSC